MWNVHGMSVDQEGNLYLAEVNNGRAQKFRPRPDADRAHLWVRRFAPPSKHARPRRASRRSSALKTTPMPPLPSLSMMR